MGIHVHKSTFFCQGTKCLGAPYDWTPATLGEMYQKIYDELGQAPFKPVPGESYRKCYKPKNGQTDMPAFRKMPSEIIITQPPRLFRSHAWTYKGRTYLDAQCHWEFQYKFWNPNFIRYKGKARDIQCTPIEVIDPYSGFIEYSHGWQYEWMPIFLLSNCYISQTLSFKIGKTPNLLNPKIKPIQLELFA